jgi:serine/threonine-protein kinase
MADADEGSGSVPTYIGQYRVTGKLGSGGMATVYLAETEIAGVPRPVAIKVLRAELDGKDWAQQLIEEARVAAAIRHPNVVQVLELGEHRDGIFLVLEFIEGANLAVLLRAANRFERAIPLRVAGKIIADVLSGLHAAHELRDAEGIALNLVHRDVSLQNIIVGCDGGARLADFGIARTAAREATQGVLKGKVRYMSPEQVLGEPLDRRSDIWSIGVVAWELVAGMRMFGEESDATILLKLISEPPPRLSSVCEVPPEIEDVIARTLTLDRESRYATAREFRTECIAAWTANGGIADHEEAGAFVRELLTGHRPSDRTFIAPVGAEVRRLDRSRS